MSDPTAWETIPRTVHAMQWCSGDAPCTGYHAQEIVAWVNDNGGEAQYDAPHGTSTGHGSRIALVAAGCWLYANPGDYVVMGREWFHDGAPCKAGPACRGGGEKAVRDFYPRDAAAFEAEQRRPVTS